MSWESAVWFQREDSRLEQPEAVVPLLLFEACCIVCWATSTFLEPVVHKRVLEHSPGLGQGAGRGWKTDPFRNFLLLKYSGHQNLAMNLILHLDREMGPLA